LSLSAKRTVQVTLRPEQLDALRSLATKQGVSVPELIREDIDTPLAETPVEEDPLWDIIGLGSLDVRDLALEHDRCLAGT
jgi:hypothetical protein